MSDTKRETIQAQAERFAGTRVAVCRRKHCKVAFLAEKRSSKWCSAGCRKAAFIKRQMLGSPARCVHCGGKVRSRAEEAICGMCGLNFDGA